ncbi:DUF605-domain-containing protein [Auriculariales sp. MPI-PUGE-AT-0066]|nr:DUF605-domain-containing protein [Auriculariales sp. MPI-PUGE-AT-0066]
MSTVPPELKPIAPYIQRAKEIKHADPVMAYWCTYYAAKQGITLKVRSKDGRAYLVELMDTLEKMKASLEDSDALGDVAGQAYIENFSLTVFEAADKEDRAGHANNNTAKKFMAASHFMEVLGIFDNMESEFAQKIKYARWRAAELNKAFREGRTPAAPAPRSPQVADDLALSFELNPPAETPIPTAPPSSLDSMFPGERPSAIPLPDSPGLPRSTLVGDNIAHIHTPIRDPIHLGGGESQDITPGMWSTVATPGVEDHYNLSNVTEDPSWSSASTLPPPAIVSSDSQESNKSAKRVHFSPSVVGGSEASTSPAQSTFDLPTLATVPESPPARAANLLGPNGTLPSVPSAPSNYPSVPPAPPRASAPPAPSYPANNHHPSPPQRVAPSAPPPPPVIALTPQLVATVQKHCKFAISALDYDDVENARQQLRTALAALGG